MENKELVLPVGSQVMCIKDCFQECEDDEIVDPIYIKGVVYTVHLQGMIKDEEGCTRQWKESWYTLSPEFHQYFKII